MPDPQAAPVQVSSLQLDILQHMVRRTTSAQRLVKRAQIILEAFKGTSNTKISQHQHVDYETVRRWRDRWRAAKSRLQAIEALLTDAQRPGAPATFTLEQFMQIMALACEKPEAADRPVSTWTPRELAEEAVKRGIVEQISARTVERFLKGERVAAPSQAVLADSTPRRSRSPGRTDLHRL
jgi:putative transposase